MEVGPIHAVDMEDVMPLEIAIDVFPTAKSNTNWDTITIDTTQIHNGRKVSGGAQNDEIAWDVLLPAGTWTIEILHEKNSDVGIYSVQFDSVEQGTIDGYNATSQDNQRGTVTGAFITSERAVELKLKMTAKNGSASAYAGRLQGLKLIRTSTAIA